MFYKLLHSLFWAAVYVLVFCFYFLASIVVFFLILVGLSYVFPSIFENGIGSCTIVCMGVYSWLIAIVLGLISGVLGCYKLYKTPKNNEFKDKNPTD